MNEQWIPARKAIEIITNEDALIERLRAGMLRATADQLQSESQTESDVLIGKRFWQHNRYYDPQFDWSAGDFRNDVDGVGEVQAMGVKFDLHGILDMVAFERRGILARSLSVAGNKDWLKADEAKKLVYASDRGLVLNAGGLIIEQARLGFLVARAVQAQCHRHGSQDDWTWQEREWDIPTSFWNEFLTPGSSEQDWALGRISGSGSMRGYICSITLSGVHFHKPSLDALLAADGCSDEDAADETQRGRRPKYDWPAAQSAIWGRNHAPPCQPGQAGHDHAENRRPNQASEPTPN